MMMKRAVTSLAIAVVSIVAPGTIRAQTSHTFSQYWEAISAAKSVPAALQVSPPETTSSEDPLVQGIVEMRTYELTYDRTQAFKATRDLELAVERDPSNAWTHFALGAMLARGSDVRERSFAQSNAYVIQYAKNSNAAARAPRELRKALELDPNLHAAAMELGSLALDLRDMSLMKEAIKLLTTGPREAYAPALMEASKISDFLGLSMEGARFADAAKSNGFDPSIADHQRAEILFHLGVVDSAADIYFHGLDELTPDGAETYYSAIALLLSKDQDATWHSLSLDAKKQWLQKYWDRSAALAGVSVARRIAEHYRRLDKLRLTPQGGLFVTGSKPDSVPTKPSFFTLLFGRPPLEEMVDPMLTLVRWGDPMRSKRFMYCEPGWDTLPVPMQPTLADCIRSPFGKSKHVPGDVNLEYDAGYARITQRLSVIRALPGEGYYPRYERNLSMAWEALQFRAENGGAQVIGAVALRGASAAALKNEKGHLEPVLNLTLADTLDDWIRRATSHETYALKNTSAQAWVLLGVAANAPAGKAVALSLAVESPDEKTGVIAHSRIDVSDFNPASLTMSDVVVSPADAYGSLTRGDVRVALAPGRSFKASETPTLYYEVYGTKNEVPLNTEIRITPLRETLLDRMRAVLGRDDGSVSLRFSDNASPHPTFGVQQKRTIGLTNLEPGVYTLKVIVTDGSGRTVTRQTFIQIDPDAPPAK